MSSVNSISGIMKTLIQAVRKNDHAEVLHEIHIAVISITNTEILE